MSRIRGLFTGFDRADTMATAVIAAAGLFSATFFGQVASGAAAREEIFLARLQKDGEKRTAKEKARIRHLLEKAAAGRLEEALDEGAASTGLEGNSQYHLFLAEGYRTVGERGRAIREYRRAVEANRGFSDRRSSLYIGKSLRPYVRESRAEYLPDRSSGSGSPERKAVISDIFYLERALAGGCF